MGREYKVINSIAGWIIFLKLMCETREGEDHLGNPSDNLALTSILVMDIYECE